MFNALRMFDRRGGGWIAMAVVILTAMAGVVCADDGVEPHHTLCVAGVTVFPVALVVVFAPVACVAVGVGLFVPSLALIVVDPPPRHSHR